MFKKLFIGAVAAIMSVGFLAVALSAHAAIIDPDSPAYQTGDYTLDYNSSSSVLNVVVGTATWILGIVGVLALVMFVYGGLTFLFSAGNSQTVATGQKILVAAVIGLVIVFASFLIIQFVLKTMGLKWQGQAGPLTSKINNQAPISLIINRS
jgi:hypothetical protein